MLYIKSQDGMHQYDATGRPITTWDAKKCNWIVNTEFENEEINWWGADNDFPRAYILADFLAQNPDWDKLPDITVNWLWPDKAACIREFGQPHTFGEKSDYWDKQVYPYGHTKNWGYLKYTEAEAIEQLGKYCGFNKNSSTMVMYNGKVIFEGILK